MSEDSTVEDRSSLGGGQDDVIGPYRLLEKLGEGGMGEVWLAEQSEPLERRVAIKVIKAGMDTKRVIARFEAERQALALMDHPAIAKVYDAGETPRGLPFFAMECVRGEPITSYCDKQKLTNEARLRLLQQVCDGVQHAHQKGIIHRDLKPGNVLVAIQDGKPVPKIIDFGVAKATAQRLTEKTLFTELGVLIGTPEYMSPEQAEMSRLDVDTRTDVYALGVMLYELLTGALPFESQALRSGSLDEIRRRIREVDPPRPSRRVSTMGAASKGLAERRRTDPRRLVSGLEGDLDWIVMKAIDKDRARRYGSPNELAADVARHLADEPVIARPPSAAYRARKFVRRHRFGVVAASIGVVALAAFGATMALQARRIARERDRAEQVSEFLTEMFESANPNLAQGDTITARDILDRGTARIEKELVGQPLVRAQLMGTMGDAYRVLGLCDEAIRLLQGAVDGRLATLGPSDPLTLRSMTELGGARWCAGKVVEAETGLREVVERSTSALGPDDQATLHAAHMLGGILRDLGRSDEAQALYRDVLERSERTLGKDADITLAILSDLSTTLAVTHPAEALELVRELLPRLRSTVGEEHPLYVVALANLADDLFRVNDIAGAVKTGEEALPLARRVMGDAAQVSVNVVLNLAVAYITQGRLADAEKLLGPWVESQRDQDPDHPRTLFGMDHLSWIYLRHQRYTESERMRLDLLAARRRSLGESHPDVARVLYGLACGAALQGKREASLDWLRQSVARGFTDADLISKDSDLQALHGDPRFDTLVAEARENAPAAP